MRMPIRKSEDKRPKSFDPKITDKKLKELQANLDRMLNIVRPKLIKEVERLGQMGDFSENAEYQIAKGKLRGLNNRIDIIKHRIDHSEVIKPSKDTSTVKLGHYVTLESNGKQKTYQILGSFETDPESGSISDSSPLGSALIGKKLGEYVEFAVRDKVVRHKITEIK